MNIKALYKRWKMKRKTKVIEAKDLGYCDECRLWMHWRDLDKHFEKHQILKKELGH